MTITEADLVRRFGPHQDRGPWDKTRYVGFTAGNKAFLVSHSGAITPTKQYALPNALEFCEGGLWCEIAVEHQADPYLPATVDTQDHW